MGLSWNKYRKQRRYLRSIGVEMDSERAERNFQEHALCGKVTIEDIPLYCGDSKQRIPTPVGYVKDLSNFVSNLLDQCEEENLLTWHNNAIPDDEIWIKIGGDYGGNSFKLMLQVANVSEANSKKNTCLITIADCKDSHKNLAKVLKPYKKEISNLEKMRWKGKKIRVVLFGDYDFILKIFGISGAQSVHPCLWCKATKSQIQKPPSAQPEIPKRSLTNLKRDHRQYKIHGSNKKKAKAYNNVVHSPLFNLQTSQVTPPYLHILLGIVKRHHDMLEQECHALDKIIADCIAEDTDSTYERNTPFGQYVSRLQNIKKKEKEYRRRENKLSEILDRKERKETGIDLDQMEEEAQRNLDTMYDILEEERNELKCNDLAFLSGPVTSNLDHVLKKNKITMQAYHGRSFVSNHCHKYLQPSVTNDICQSVVEKTFQLSDSVEVQTKAHDIASKFQILNEFFARVHKHIAHALPTTDEEINKLDSDIIRYMDFYRTSFGKHRIIPKQHILECHSTYFMRIWKFGLGFLGEQGGEETHAFINELKVRVRGIVDPEQKIRVLMKEQLTIVSPRVKATMPTSKRQKKQH